jgi:acyl-CoA synthetase (AMP-forming)/AMP-acid ligase II
MSTMLREPRLVTLLHQRALDTPDRVAYEFHHDGQIDQLTYQQLAGRAARLAGSLLRRQASAGKGPALLLYPPGLDYVAALFACFLARVPAVPVYPPDPWRPQVGVERLSRLASDAQPTAMLADRALLPVLDLAALPAHELSLVEDDGDRADPDSHDWPSGDVDDVAILQYTSGSTRAPRGVMVRHRNLEHNLAAIARCFRLTETSRGFSWLPPYHDMGLVGGILTPIYAGIPVGLMSPLDFLKNPLSWLRKISETGTTASGGPNFAYELCVRRDLDPEALAGLDLSCWSVAFNGAEPVRWQTLQAFAHKFAPAGFRPSALFPCYGLAEATLLVAGRYWDGTAVRGTTRITVEHLLQRSGSVPLQPPARVSCGFGLPDQELAVVDPEAAIRCPDGTEGEIWVRGPSITSGYWSSGEDCFGVLGGARFLRTGDLGYLADGELVITGRCKDVVVHRGVNYHAGDLEEAAVAGTPGLRPVAAAFSVDGQEHTVVVLVVEARPSAGDPAQVADAVRSRVLAAIGLSPGVVVVAPPGTIPRTSSGKVQRGRCRDRFVAGEFDDVAFGGTAGVAGGPLTTDPDLVEALTGLIRGVFAAVCQVPKCGPESSLYEIGGDSLRGAEIAGVLENALRLPVAAELVLESLTPAGLAGRLVERWRTAGRGDRQLLERLEELARETGPTS